MNHPENTLAKIQAQRGKTKIKASHDHAQLPSNPVSLPTHNYSCQFGADLLRTSWIYVQICTYTNMQVFLSLCFFNINDNILNIFFNSFFIFHSLSLGNFTCQSIQTYLIIFSLAFHGMAQLQSLNYFHRIRHKMGNPLRFYLTCIVTTTKPSLALVNGTLP